ncbi:MAG: FAD-dependent oxidoreductase [Halioglobus sp.]|nr:FAD-dependent oxidoreductase [Halioglobus sp.]
MDTAKQAAPEKYVRTRIAAIGRQRRHVIDSKVLRTTYCTLVLATGSRPSVPSLTGTGLSGVYTFRNMADAEKLDARRVLSKHTVVFGADLSGVEAARGMQRYNTRVTLIDHTPYPMYRQLDALREECLRTSYLRVEFNFA